MIRDVMTGNVALEIRGLFERHGHEMYEDARMESVSALQHALQCAQLAEWADADTSLVIAALLHDLGHFIPFDSSAFDGDGDDVHELRAIPFLSTHFSPHVVEPVRLHVQAKRYLVSIDRSYLDTLTPVSRYALDRQGGPMCADERALFEELPFARDAIALRRWDDMAKETGKRTPPLAYYLRMIDSACSSKAPAVRRREPVLFLPKAARARYAF
jgi:predicted HD phosphohydrolase